MADNNPFQDIERVFGLMSEQFGAESAGVPADVIDRGDAFEVRADVPGFDGEDVEVTLSDGRQLEIVATREEEATVSEDGRFVQRERHRERARRTLTLPEPVEAEETEAGVEDGVLTVRLPKQRVDEDGTEIPVN